MGERIEHALNKSLLLEFWQRMVGQYTSVLQVQPPWHGALTLKGCSSAPLPSTKADRGMAGWLQTAWGPFQHRETPNFGNQANRSPMKC